MGFYREHLFNRHWGEQIAFGPGNTMSLGLVFADLEQHVVEGLWAPYLKEVGGSNGRVTGQDKVRIITLPARHFWDVEFLRKAFPGFVVGDDRPGAPEGNAFWSTDRDQVGQFIHGYSSTWLPGSLLDPDPRGRLTDALFEVTRH
jgi:hypothetical protein